jgi:undecaprenyl-diphosphatase
MTILFSLLRDWIKALGPWRLGVAVLTAVLLGWAAPKLTALGQSQLDEQMLEGIHRLIPDPIGELLLRVYQMSGVHFTGVLVLAVLIFLALKRFWAELICLVVGTGGILLVVDRWLKPLFNRPRPSGALLKEISGRSFPSGHAAGSVVFYFLTCCLLSAHYPRLRRPLFVVSSAWVGLVWLSTLYCRAHWLSDIAAGAAVGYVWLSFCLAGFTVWEQRCRPASPPSPHG